MIGFEIWIEMVKMPMVVFLSVVKALNLGTVFLENDSFRLVLKKDERCQF